MYSTQFAIFTLTGAASDSRVTIVMKMATIINPMNIRDEKRNIMVFVVLLIDLIF